ncbi:hypothetical protein ACFU8W_01840 [Streptomyces sp. NPDC057565]|uniref:hypothetical protein n=1 Tax=Streptomyces sp. NPDC057565 TaxID=3346169 RepID=UPI00367BC99E
MRGTLVVAELRCEETDSELLQQRVCRVHHASVAHPAQQYTERRGAEQVGVGGLVAQPCVGLGQQHLREGGCLALTAGEHEHSGGCRLRLLLGLCTQDPKAGTAHLLHVVGQFRGREACGGAAPPQHRRLAEAAVHERERDHGAAVVRGPGRRPDGCHDDGSGHADKERSTLEVLHDASWCRALRVMDAGVQA